MAAAKQKWWQVYSNDEEKRVFVGKDGNSGLIRSPEGYKWRTLERLASESGLTKVKCEAILNKYLKAGLIVQNDSGDKFGYWELVAPHLGKPAPSGPVQSDQKNRMDKAAKKV
jgi:hypothetical protein